jgi:hypothetical protein
MAFEDRTGQRFDCAMIAAITKRRAPMIVARDLFGGTMAFAAQDRKAENSARTACGDVRFNGYCDIQ